MPSLVVNDSLQFKGLKGLEFPKDKPLVLSLDDEQAFVSHADQGSRNFFLLLNGCSPNLSRKIDPANLSQLIALGRGHGVSGVAVIHGQDPCIIELKMPHQYVFTEMRSFAISVSPAGVHVLRMGLGLTLIHPEAMIDFNKSDLLPLSVKSECWNSNVELRKLGFSPPSRAEGFIRMRIPTSSTISFHPTVGSEDIISRGIWSTIAQAAKLQIKMAAPATTGTRLSLGPAYTGGIGENIQVFLQTDLTNLDHRFRVQATFLSPFLPRLEKLERIFNNLKLKEEIPDRGDFMQARAAGVKATDIIIARASAEHLDSLADFIRELRSLY